MAELNVLNKKFIISVRETQERFIFKISPNIVHLVLKETGIDLTTESDLHFEVNPK